MFTEKGWGLIHESEPKKMVIRWLYKVWAPFKIVIFDGARFYTAYNYITTLHYIPLHSITLHYITLHYITLSDTAPPIDR
jgi:hypothetical protein